MERKGPINKAIEIEKNRKCRKKRKGCRREGCEKKEAVVGVQR